jgi:hypothetical protein
MTKIKVLSPLMGELDGSDDRWDLGPSLSCSLLYSQPVVIEGTHRGPVLTGAGIFYRMAIVAASRKTPVTSVSRKEECGRVRQTDSWGEIGRITRVGIGMFQPPKWG